MHAPTVGAHSHEHDYALLHLRDGLLRAPPEPRTMDAARSVPVLFAHGHKGSYRSIQAVAALAAEQLQVFAGDSQLDFFTIDFRAGSSAFHGAVRACVPA